jgi:hypothetical protein
MLKKCEDKERSSYLEMEKVRKELEILKCETKETATKDTF